MKNSATLILLMLSLIFGLSYASAQTDQQDKLSKALAKYTKGENVKKCVSISRIQNSTVIDDQHILFEFSGAKAYLNTLPYKCPRLGFTKAFSYVTSQNQLCDLDIITVFDGGANMSGASCGLGKFEEYQKIPKKK